MPLDMIPLPRVLRLAEPLQRGEDVALAQTLLLRADPAGAGREIRVVDGLFGPATWRAVLAFQHRAALPEVDGVIGPKTWAVLQLWRDGRGPPAAEAGAAIAGIGRRHGPEAVLAVALPSLRQFHAVFSGGLRWRLTPDGVEVEGRPPPGADGAGSLAARRAFEWFGAPLRRAAAETGVPVELLVATACTEVLGDTRAHPTPAAAAAARREEPGFAGDEATPHRVSVGLMQTLVSTARQVLPLPEGDPDPARITAARLRDPALSILAGAAFIAAQAPRTRLDPPVVACAYNAGAIHEQTGPGNHWRMRQYPIGTPRHADRFAIFFNAALRLVAEDPSRAADAPSFHRLLAISPSPPVGGGRSG